MNQQTSRERVQNALMHKVSDRVPFALGGTAQKINNSVTLELLEYFGISEKPQKVLAGLDFMYYSLPLMCRLGVDFAYLFLNPPLNYAHPESVGDTIVDEWGLTRTRYENFIHLHGKPLKDAGIEQIRKYQGPDPTDPNRIGGLPEKAKAIFQETDLMPAAHRPLPLGIFEMACSLRDTEQLFLDLLLNKALVHTLMDKLLEINIGFYEIQTNALGEYVKLFEVTDDMASQQGLMISPEMYREFLKPRHKQIVEYIKMRVPDSKVLFHSCGAVAKLIPDFIELGVDIINPVQPLAKGMNLKFLKEEYGKDIVFCGGLDVQDALRKDFMEIDAEVKRCIREGAYSGGYIAGPSHDIGKDIPLKNIIYVSDAVMKYGSYPC